MKKAERLDHAAALLPVLLLGYSLLTPIIWGMYCFNQPVSARQDCRESLNGFTVAAIGLTSSLITSTILAVSGVLDGDEHATQTPSDPSQLKL